MTTFNWIIQRRNSGGPTWQTLRTVSTAATFATYTAQEDDTGFRLRAGVASYTDRRGTGKSAESEATQPVTADPIVNAPPGFLIGGNFEIAEGEGGRNVGTPLTATDRDNDTLTLGIEATDDFAFFELNASTRRLRLAKAVDYETRPDSGFYLVTINLHDGKDADGNPEADPVNDTTLSVPVRVTDVEEDGVVTLSADEPEAGTLLEATLEDGDGSVSGESWQWARSEDGQTNWFSISGATFSSYTPGADDEDFYLSASVTYTDNRGGGKSAQGVTTGRVPSENRRPTFPSTEDGQRTVAENTRANANIGAPVAAVDPEDHRLTYSLTGDDADTFDIVASSGQLRTKDALDFETKSSYSVTVNVRDAFNAACCASSRAGGNHRTVRMSGPPDLPR